MHIVVCFSVAVNRVATYRELDNDLLRQAAFLTLVRFTVYTRAYVCYEGQSKISESCFISDKILLVWVVFV